jgi:outer membrane receptor protein involved in Fe transport
MFKILKALLLTFIFTTTLSASKIKGFVLDKATNEPLIGAIIKVNELNTGTVSGLDGSFKLKHLKKGMYTLTIKYIGYETTTLQIDTEENEDQEDKIDIALTPKNKSLNEIEVIGRADVSTDASARFSERESPNLQNIVSATTIQLSPDLEVSSVVQRMSGVTLDKSSNGSTEYAQLRGMDKRYCYTLVNGVKIPSTDNTQRYTPLNIFPSELMDRVEVSKVLTPDLEGDAIAGAVNMVMKNAPDHFMISANVGSGYNFIWDDNKCQTFNNSVINIQSPYEAHGVSYLALPSDFTKTNLDLHSVNVPINTNAGFAIGNRFFNKKFGWIFATSFNNSFAGSHKLLYDDKLKEDGSNVLVLTDMIERFDNNHRQNYGIHNKFDFSFSSNHSIQLYLAYMNFQIIQVRDDQTTSFDNSTYDPAHGGENDTHSDRNMWNIQSLLNATLQGNHCIGSHLFVQWSAVYSNATNQTPDMSDVTYDQTYVNFKLQPQYVDFGGIDRLWLHNSDVHKSAYLNLKYKTQVFGGHLELTTGGLYRDVVRESFYNDYTLMPQGPVDQHSAKGIDWNQYSDINWTVVDPSGAVNTAGTFNAYERDRALFGMLLYKIKEFRIIGGVRYEQFNQGYDELFHNLFLDKYKPGNNQKRDKLYMDYLPSANMEYTIATKSNIKASYFKAVNKPGFLEIVPYLDNTGDYPVTGNPDLKMAIADNYDVRYEYFPNHLDQLLVGCFYKKIDNAIEQGFTTDGHGNYNLTYSNSNATNYGLETDFVKFFREFGVRGNYTWTHSLTSSFKRYIANGVLPKDKDSTYSFLSYRPLAGQAENVGNISLLYKGTNNGYDAQIAFSYTGDRIVRVSPDINGDIWQKGFWQLDFSAEKKFKNGLSLFLKAKNLLNTHTYWYLKYANNFNNQFPGHANDTQTTSLRDEYTGASILIGIRYKLN